MSSFKRKTLIASTLACGLFAALQLPQALAKDNRNDRNNDPRNDMMNHGQRGTDRMSDRGTAHNNMDHDRNLQRMYENNGQTERGNMGQGRQNHGPIPPAQGNGKRNGRGF